jgi:hypothetical protein
MSRPRAAVIAALTLAVIALAACRGSTSNDRHGYQRLPFASFNQTLPLTGPLSNSPSRIALRYLNLRADGGNESPAVSIQQSISGDKATVKVLADQLADDSVRARRYRVELSKHGSGWQIAWAGFQQRCRADRGHQDFSIEPCL